MSTTVEPPRTTTANTILKALRMRADVLQREFKKGGLLQDLLLRYTQAFITQIAQTAACNRAHSIEGRLSKWLLMCEDRANSTQLELTHELIAMMLGVRRAGVNGSGGRSQIQRLHRLPAWTRDHS